jgi:hypothetical protein
LTARLMRSTRSSALGYAEGAGPGNSPWSNRGQRKISVAQADPPEARPAITAATTGPSFRVFRARRLHPEPSVTTELFRPRRSLQRLRQSRRAGPSLRNVSLLRINVTLYGYRPAGRPLQWLLGRGANRGSQRGAGTPRSGSGSSRGSARYVDHGGQTSRLRPIPGASLFGRLALPVLSIYFPVRPLREFTRKACPFQRLGSSLWAAGSGGSRYFPIFSRLPGNYARG